MDIVVLVGRILFVFLFLTSGVAHFTKRQMTAGYAASKVCPPRWRLSSAAESSCWPAH
jgi:uncharacterized membrane protein YphA (DoxX/SURF4 family)